MLRERRGAAIVLTLFLALGASSVYEILAEQAEQPSYAHHRGETNQRTASDDPLNRFWEWSTHDAVAFFTFVLAVFTGALVIV